MASAGCGKGLDLLQQKPMDDCKCLKNILFLTIDSQEVAKLVHRFLCTLHPASPSGVILHIYIHTHTYIVQYSTIYVCVCI